MSIFNDNANSFSSNVSHVSVTPEPTGSFHHRALSNDSDDQTSVATEGDMRVYAGVGQAIQHFYEQQNAALADGEDLPDTTDGRGSSTQEDDNDDDDGGILHSEM